MKVIVVCLVGEDTNTCTHSNVRGTSVSEGFFYVYYDKTVTKYSMQFIVKIAGNT